MLDALVRTVLVGNGKIDAGIIQHPLGIVRLGDRRLCAEQGRIERNGSPEVGHADVNVKAFHTKFPGLEVGGEHAASSAQDAPPQQFSVR